MSSEPREAELARVQGGFTAESILAALRGSGIPARMQGEPLGMIYRLTLDGLGEVTIFVPEECLEEAKAVLAAGEHGDLLLSDCDSVDEIEPDR